MNTRLIQVLALLCLILNYNYATGQLTISGQLRTRAELRDGQGSPLPKDADPALFISQRSRLNLDYNTARFSVGFTVQDVRVWGQDVSTINRTTVQNNNGLMLHEAWAELLLTDTADKQHRAMLRFGRQEIILDDQRLAGNLDWLQQARHHDAIIFKYQAANWQLKLGGAYNQNKENAAGTIYQAVAPGNYTQGTNGSSMYKSFGFAHLNRQLKKGSLSLLVFADQFNKFKLDSVSNKAWIKGSWNRVTAGLYLNKTFGSWDLTASGYVQTGRTAENQRLRAILFSANLLHRFSKSITAGPGMDFTSGGRSGKTSNAFDPLYGTPHKFWGLMDYFYAGNGFGNTGLVDYYLKSSYTMSSGFKLNADIHQFNASSNILNTSGKKASRNFGTELDLVLQRTLTPAVSLEAGYSHFFSSTTLALPQVKNVTNAQSNNNWAYLMVTIKPVFFRSADRPSN